MMPPDRRRSLSNLYRKARRRPPGYLRDVLRHVTAMNKAEGWYIIPNAAFVALRERWTPWHEKIGPGDAVALLVKVFTFGRLKMCAKCRNRRTVLNGRGWGDVFRNPGEVLRVFLGRWSWVIGG